MEIIREAAAGNCVEKCEALWLRCAEEVSNSMQSCKFRAILFAAAVRDLLMLGKGEKKRKFMTDGPTN